MGARAMSDEDIKDIIRGACDGTNNVTFQQLEDALVQQKKFGGIPVFYAKKEVVEDLQKKQIRELSEQLEKVRVRRDGWRERAEKAEARAEQSERVATNISKRVAGIYDGILTIQDCEIRRQLYRVKQWQRVALALTVIYAAVCVKVLVFP
jgi:ABC-type phosphate transport system auxiliary subunit